MLLELITKNSYLNNYSEKIFCQAYCFNFFPSQNRFFAKQIVLILNLTRTAFLSDIWLEELMPTTWHSQRWWSFQKMSEDKKKEIEPIFTE